MATHLKRGWVPSDEGYFGQTAERVLHGELPHKDFDEGYTGGITFLNALAFRELGINSVSLRIVLFLFFIAWVPAILYVAGHFLSPLTAGALTLLAVAWSVPNYSAPALSWYNLFFATFGVAALLRYLDTNSWRWLFAAGLCGGFSILAKITGLYYVAAVLLFFVFREQCIASEQNPDSRHRARLYASTVVLGLTAFVLLLFRLVHKVPGIPALTFFGLPAFCLVVLLLARELTGIPGRNGRRFLTLIDLCVPFGVGLTLPVIAFVIPYVRTGSVHSLLYGIFTLPMKRFAFAVVAPPNPIVIAEIIPFTLPVIIAFDSGRIGRLVCGGILASFCGIVLVGSEKSTLLYGFGWRSLATSIPVLILAGVVVLWVSRSGKTLTSLRQQQFMLLVCVTALCSIVQFPFSVQGYVCYIAPILILGVAALFSSLSRPPRFVLGTLLVFYLLFVSLRVTPAFIYDMGVRYSPDTQTQRLTLARAGGLRVDPTDEQVYKGLIPLVQSHAGGRFIYCTPDCPEVYFFSGLDNPTRDIYDFNDVSAGRTNRILQMLENRRINVVAINDKPVFSGPLDLVLRHALEQRYAHAAQFGSFEVRWNQ